MSKQTVQDFKTALLYHRQGLTEKQRQATYKAKPPKPRYPLQIERRYGKYITDIMINYVKIVKREIMPNLTKWLDMANPRTDAKLDQDDWTNELQGTINEMEALTIQMFNDNIQKAAMAVVLINVFRSTSKWTRKEFDRIIKVQTGIVPVIPESWMSGLEVNFLQKNTELIKGLTDEYRKKIQTIVSNGVSTGQSYKNIATEIQKVSENMSDYRAKLIARDQVAKTVGSLERYRQQDIGVTIYIWNTANDERVRSKHKALSGKYCKWSDNNVYSDDGNTWNNRTSNMYVGIPGSDIQCRCFSESYLADILKEIDNKI